MRAPMSRVLTRAPGLAVLLLALAAGGSHAASVGPGEGICGSNHCWAGDRTLLYRAAPGERNAVGVELQGEELVIADGGGVGIAARGACRAEGSVARCPVGDAWALYVVTDDADDRIAVDPTVRSRLPVLTWAGEGNDHLTGSGSGQLSGGGGHDELLPGPGLAESGSSPDLVWYADRAESVFVRLGTDGSTSGNGGAGESDRIHDGLERVRGGSGNDHLIGDDDRNELSGADGADVIEGHGGNDVLLGERGASTLRGGEGDDLLLTSEDFVEIAGGPGWDEFADDRWSLASLTVSLDDQQNDGVDLDGDQAPDNLGNVRSDVDALQGGAGYDRLTGSAGANQLSGAAGDDRLDGGPGADRIAGGEGDDVLIALDGDVDELTCGEGMDVVAVDSVDAVAADCERSVDRIEDLPPAFDPGELARSGTAVVWVTSPPQSGMAIHYVGGAATDSDLTVSVEPDPWGSQSGPALVTENGPPLRPGPGCERTSKPGQVRCQHASLLDIEAGDGDDRLNVVAPYTSKVRGGPGRDQLSTRTTQDWPRALLSGGPGSDTLVAEGGDNILAGGQGDDSVSVPSGRNLLCGGDAWDTDRGWYSCDPLDSGDDTLEGGAGFEQAFGGDGADRLVGGAGPDYLHGEEGDDRVEALDGMRDVLSCGPGNDQVTVDLVDQLAPGCETGRPIVVPSGPPLPPGRKLGLDLPSRGLLKDGSVLVFVGCRYDRLERCSGRLSAAVPLRRARGRTARTLTARGHFRLRPGRERRLRLTVGRSQRKLLMRSALQKARLTVTVRKRSVTVPLRLTRRDTGYF